ncbi:hypothetical protein ABBQ32_003509 [Trebouxia sp. C0010 RCD-2024]
MDVDVVTRLRQLLQDVDMETTTEKQLRKTLEKDLGRDLSGHKALIRAEIEQYLENQQPDAAEVKAEDEDDEGDNQETEEEQEEPEPQVGKKRKGRGFGTCILSEPLAKFMGTDRAPRTEVVKKIWAHIREHDLQNPKDRRKIIPDEVLGTFLTAPVNMMSMNSQLTKHCFTKDRFDEMNGDEDEGEDAEPKARAKPRPKKPKINADGEEKKPRAPGKPVRTSDEMAAWLGGQQVMSRPQITSFFWEYIKSQNLLNPANKREVLCNDVLKSLTGQDKFLAFGGQKYFSQHILKET